MKHLYALLVMTILLGLSSSAQAQKQRTTEFESGMMEKGQKIGVWEYYSYTRDGRQVIVQRYDHTAKKLVFFRPIEDKPYEAELKPGEWTRTNVEQPPLYIGGDAVLATLMSKLTYPQEAQNRNIQGRVLVEFAIDTLGHASKHKVLNGIGGGCDEEALRLCQSIPAQWIPARLAGKPVPVIYQLPFTFRLQKAQ
ncbi:energy transducer TonB [Hymenobacter sp.]|jgi:protein TonB|uniref:energy transducer TonB n=1 Tax=Hymenobacter sp. TaxID=1898978 RepID=UPI002ED79D95